MHGVKKVAAFRAEIVPGIFSMEALFAPTGQRMQPDGIAGAREYRYCQFMTPETQRTTHFFWSCLNNYEGDDLPLSRTRSSTAS